jgi:hypothetical protein
MKAVLGMTAGAVGSFVGTPTEVTIFIHFLYIKIGRSDSNDKRWSTSGKTT